MNFHWKHADPALIGSCVSITAFIVAFLTVILQMQAGRLFNLFDRLQVHCRKELLEELLWNLAIGLPQMFL